MSEEDCELRLTMSSDSQSNHFETLEVSDFPDKPDKCGTTKVFEEPTKDSNYFEQIGDISRNLHTDSDVPNTADTLDSLNDNLSNNNSMSSDLQQNETLLNLSVCDEYTLYSTLKNIFGTVDGSSEEKIDKELETSSQFGLEDSDCMHTTCEELNDLDNKVDLSGTDADMSVEKNVEIVSQLIGETEKRPTSVQFSNDINLSSSLNVVRHVSDSENCVSALSDISVRGHKISSHSVQCVNYSSEISNQINTLDVATQCSTPDILATIEYHEPALCNPVFVISRSVQCDIDSKSCVQDKSPSAKSSKFPSVNYSNSQQKSVLEQCSKNGISPSLTSLTDICYCCCREFKSSELTYLRRYKPDSAESRGSVIKTNVLPLSQYDSSENFPQTVKNCIPLHSAVNSVANISKTKFPRTRRKDLVFGEGENIGGEKSSYQPQTFCTREGESKEMQTPWNFRERDLYFGGSSKTKERTSSYCNLYFNSLACERTSSPEDLDDELPLSKTNHAQFVEKVLSTSYINIGNLPKEKSHRNKRLKKGMQSLIGSNKTMNVPELVVISDSNGEETSVLEGLVPNKGSNRKLSFCKKKNARRRVSDYVLESRPTFSLKDTINTKGKKSTSCRHSLKRRMDLTHQKRAHSSKSAKLVSYDSTSTEYNSSSSQSDSEESCVFVVSPQRRKLAKEKYTQSEREQILEYIINHRAYDHVRYDDFWKKMKAAGVCKNHSWASMKNHFQTQLRFQIKSFNLGKKIEKKFYKKLF